MFTQIRQLPALVRLWLGTFAREERGDFGLGSIVAIVATIIIIGVIISIVTGLMPDWIDYLWQQITGLFDSFGAG